MIRCLPIFLTLSLFLTSNVVRATEAKPLAIGETFTIESKILGETRRINIYATHPYGEPEDTPLPVLYMPDGGLTEDFLHVAGLIQVSVGNGTMRPFLLVGIENTQRRRDLTGLTEDPEDKKIAPKVGESKAFREFIRNELMPEVKQRYLTTNETAIVGESLAGLFVVETFLLEPDLFDSYLAFDPSLWWNSQHLVGKLDSHLPKKYDSGKTLYFVTSSQKDIAEISARFAATLQKKSVPGLTLRHVAMPEETHSSIYHPAAIKAFREVFKPAPKK